MDSFLAGREPLPPLCPVALSSIHHRSPGGFMTASANKGLSSKLPAAAGVGPQRQARESLASILQSVGVVVPSRHAKSDHAGARSLRDVAISICELRRESVQGGAQQAAGPMPTARWRPARARRRASSRPRVQAWELGCHRHHRAAVRCAGICNASVCASRQRTATRAPIAARPEPRRRGRSTKWLVRSSKNSAGCCVK